MAFHKIEHYISVFSTIYWSEQNNNCQTYCCANSCKFLCLYTGIYSKTIEVLNNTL